MSCRPSSYLMLLTRKHRERTRKKKSYLFVVLWICGVHTVLLVSVCWERKHTCLYIYIHILADKAPDVRKAMQSKKRKSCGIPLYVHAFVNQTSFEPAGRLLTPDDLCSSCSKSNAPFFPSQLSAYSARRPETEHCVFSTFQHLFMGAFMSHLHFYITVGTWNKKKCCREKQKFKNVINVESWRRTTTWFTNMTVNNCERLRKKYRYTTSETTYCDNNIIAIRKATYILSFKGGVCRIRPGFKGSPKNIEDSNSPESRTPDALC